MNKYFDTEDHWHWLQMLSQFLCRPFDSDSVLKEREIGHNKWNPIWKYHPLKRYSPTKIFVIALKNLQGVEIPFLEIPSLSSIIKWLLEISPHLHVGIYDENGLLYE